MNAADLISARERGIPFERILNAIQSDRESLSSLPEDQVEFFESMLSEVKKAIPEFEQAVRSDNLEAIKRTCSSLNEILTMVMDSCESSRTTDK